MLLAVLHREFKSAWQQRSEIIHPLVFFVLVMLLFPLALGSDPQLLSMLAPGIVWVDVLLAIFLGFSRLFQEDYDNGTLEQWLLSPHSFTGLVMSKVFAHWVLTVLPLIVIAPLLAMMLGLPLKAYMAMEMSLLLGTPLLVLLGSVGSALTVSIKSSGVLLALLIFPWFIPVLIFGSNIIISATIDISYSGQLALLAALLVFGIMTLPWAISKSLTIMMRQ
jgi:heme exporter protein B